jgi:hypothetical protein
LQAEVLRLPPAERAALLDSLIVSLDADAEAEAAWDALADERERALRASVGRKSEAPSAAGVSR